MATRKREAAGTEERVITLARLRDQRITLVVEGLTPVIPHRWSEKSKRLMPGHPEGAEARREKKGLRTKEAEAEACLYRLPDGRQALPATAFKAAMVAACRFFDRPSMTEAKALFFVEGEGPEQLVPFAGTPTLREDTPRNATGTADLRYRYSFFPWRAELTIRYMPSMVSESTIVALLDAAGRVGIGDWRPGSPKSATGTYGQFRVPEGEQIDAGDEATAAAAATAEGGS